MDVDMIHLDVSVSTEAGETPWLWQLDASFCRIRRLEDFPRSRIVVGNTFSGPHASCGKFRPSVIG